jgi:6-phosphogluconolactonase
VSGAIDERVERFDSIEAMATAASCRVVDHIRAGFRRRGRASLALAGGRTPLRIYEELSRWPLRWEWVDIVPTSERWVSRLSLERNGAVIRAKLLKNEAAAANYHPLIEPWETDPGHNALMWATAKAEETVSRLGRLDLALLGMGADGHVASLFAANPAARALLDPDGPRSCLLTPPAPPGPRQPRITLTFAKIAAARHVVVVIRGEQKLEALRRAWSGAGPPSAIGALLQQHRTPVEVLWAP